MRGPENRTFTVCTVGVRALPEQPRRYTGVPGARRFRRQRRSTTSVQLRHYRHMDRQDPIYASIGCAGTVHIGREHHAQDPELYEMLASTFGDLLSGWEQGDTFHLGITHGTGPVDMPEQSKQKLRPSEERIQNGLDTLIELVGAVRSMDKPLSEQDYEWKPSKQARKRLETLVEYVLRGDARWRNEHPEEEW